MLVPAGVVMNRISRLIDVGVELQEALGVGRVSSLEDLQRAFSKYVAWADDIALALSRSFGGSSTTVEYAAMPQPAVSVDDQSRTEVIQLLRTAIDARLSWLGALNERVKQ